MSPGQERKDQLQWRVSAGARRSVRVRHRQNRARPPGLGAEPGRARAASMRSCVPRPAYKALCTGGHLAPGFCRDLVCRQSGWEEAWAWCPGQVLSSPCALGPCRVPDAESLLAGILTKPDLVDKGTEDQVVGVVRNLVCHLKKGYMIVKCRGQQDIQTRLSLAEALQKEKAFFEDHPQFRWVGRASRGPVPEAGVSPVGKVSGLEQALARRVPAREPVPVSCTHPALRQHCPGQARGPRSAAPGQGRTEAAC